MYLEADEPQHFRRTALSVACRLGHVEMVRLLLDASGDPYLGGSHGHAVFQATDVGHLDVQRLLMSQDIATNQSRFWVAESQGGAAALAVFDGNAGMRMFWRYSIRAKRAAA
ncbi:Ankrd17 [Symbiodinium pilosum]|uniref:Ankrd17 protein n=1 Tax=Symbiodinium pilosum TaxID=2952 RepID=A0A812VK77_SYMPI|nr:Ankrd17 [Symbiodinium pilosum]